jgi:hypothetical protein
MEEVIPKKCMNLSIVGEFGVTPSKMVDPILACILNFERKTVSKYSFLNFAYKCTW